MKINMTMKRYDVVALDDVYKIADEFNLKSYELEILGKIMLKRLDEAADQFTSINYKRVKEATENFVKKMNLMQKEVIELGESCRAFAEKLEMEIWSLK